MPSVAQVMDGIEVRLRTITGVRTFGYPKDEINPPAAVVNFPDLIDYDLVMARGADRWTIVVRVFVSRTSDRAGKAKLAAFLDPTGATSVKAAIEGDRTLGGVVDTVRVRKADNAGVFTVADVDYYGADFTLDVIA